MDDATLSDMHHFLKYAVAVYALDPQAVTKQQRWVTCVFCCRMPTCLHVACMLFCATGCDNARAVCTAASPCTSVGALLHGAHACMCAVLPAASAGVWGGGEGAPPAEEAGNVAGAVLSAGEEWTGAPDAGGETVYKVWCVLCCLLFCCVLGVSSRVCVALSYAQARRPDRRQ